MDSLFTQKRIFFKRMADLMLEVYFEMLILDMPLEVAY